MISLIDLIFSVEEKADLFTEIEIATINKAKEIRARIQSRRQAGKSISEVDQKRLEEADSAVRAMREMKLIRLKRQKVLSNNARNNIVGFVLYRLTDLDLKR